MCSRCTHMVTDIPTRMHISSLSAKNDVHKQLICSSNNYNAARKTFLSNRDIHTESVCSTFHLFSYVCSWQPKNDK